MRRIVSTFSCDIVLPLHSPHAHPGLSLSYGARCTSPTAGLTFSINASEFLYGDFINALITFFSIAAAIYFLIVRPYESYKQRRGISPDTRPCPECTTEIPLAAKRCPSCTAQVSPTAG